MRRLPYILSRAMLAVADAPAQVLPRAAYHEAIDGCVNAWDAHSRPGLCGHECAQVRATVSRVARKLLREAALPGTLMGT